MSEKPLNYTSASAEIEADPLEFEETQIDLQKAGAGITSYEQGRALAQAAALAESRKPVEKHPTMFIEMKWVGGRVSEERHNLASQES